jgi:acyl-CoA thioester hydrolase|tara:strand:+ start:1340 stop:1798 length:459 start_codon:yes stop_codon:yes gene_type:complete
MESIKENIDQVIWDYPNPFTVSITVSNNEIDQLGHTNNQVYLDWMMKAAYEHSESLGLSVNDYLSIGIAMVAKRHEINYLSATFINDNLIVGTWIATNDNRFRSMRKYQIIRMGDQKTILRAETDWVSLNIDNGKPERMPDEFIRCYQPTIT